jgi:hypothetical protein
VRVFHCSTNEWRCVVAKDFQSIILQAVLALDPNTKESRRAIYDRARRAVATTPGVRLADLEMVDLAIVRVEEKVNQFLSSAEFSRSRPFRDGSGVITRPKSKWVRFLVQIFKSVALTFTVFGVVGGVGISAPIPIIESTHSLHLEQNTQVNFQYEIGPSKGPPEPPTPLGPHAVKRESKEPLLKDRLLSLEDVVALLRDLRFKLIGNSELLERLENVLDIIAKSADKLIDDRKLIEQMFELAQALAEIEEERDREERDREIANALLAIESVVAFAKARS